MYLKLKDNYALRGWKGVPYGLVDMRTGDLRVLDGEEFLLFGFFNGKRVIEKLWLSARQEEALAEARKNGLVTESAEASPIRAVQCYKQSPGGYIQKIRWSITGACDLRCRHCYLDAPHRQYGDLDTARCLAVIRQMAEANVAGVELSGGEPLLRPDFWELVDAFSEAGIAVLSLHTNGGLLDDAFFENLEKRAFGRREAGWREDGRHEYGWEFVLSLDCLGGHDWLRGVEGTEKAVIAAIRRLRGAGRPVYIKTKLHRGNAGQLLPTYELLKDLGVEKWKVSPVLPMGAWKSGGYGMVSEDLLIEPYRALVRRWRQDGRPMNLSLHENLFHGRAGNERSPQEAPPPDSEAAYHQLSCGRCRSFPYLLPDGRLLPCWGFTGSVLEPEMPLLTQTTLAEVYGASAGAFHDLVNIRKDEVLAHNAECNDCAYRPRCCGGCRADSILNGNGLLGRGAFMCSFLKKDYPASLKAIAGV